MKVKMTLLAIFCTTFLNFLSAQDTLPYTFSVDHETYLPIENATILENGFWDEFYDRRVVFPIGFDFLLFDDQVDTLYIDGYFGDSALLNNPDTMGTSHYVFPFFADLISRTDSSGVLTSISAVTEGAAGNRIYKAQWSNVGFYEDDSGLDYINFQLWLYEESGDIEFHYGPSSLLTPIDQLFYGISGPLVGFINGYDDFNDKFEYAMLLADDVNDPSLVVVDSNEDPVALNAQPQDGTVYRFSRKTVEAVSQNKTQPLQVFPTIVENELNLRVENISDLSYQILDMTGNVIINSTPLLAKHINLSILNKGMYVIRLFGDGAVIKAGRFVKQ